MTEPSLPAPLPRGLAQLEVPDYEIGLRGKLLRPTKLDGSSAISFCTIVYGLSQLDEVTDTAFSSAGNGFPDLQVMVDDSTRIRLPWRAGAEAVIGELVTADGVPFEASPRAVLARLADAYAAHGLTPVLGFEYEVWLVHTPPSERSHPRDADPFGRTHNAYSLSRAAASYPLASEFVDRMDAVGIEVEAFHSELGPGFFEFTLAPAPAVAAADAAARARQYLRDLCAEHGLTASFMAKPFGAQSGAGGHVHSSLSRDGVNIFADTPGTLSTVGAQYLAGLVGTMPDLTVLFNPFVNSFKRIDPQMFTATRASWGGDDRRVACRTLLDSVGAARVEHRRPGADANPYVVAAAILAGGLAGIDGGWSLPGPEDQAPLPGDLRAAIETLRSSTLASKLLGEPFVAAFAATRQAELDRYETWLRTTITDWELRRHLENR